MFELWSSFPFVKYDINWNLLSSLSVQLLNKLSWDLALQHQMCIVLLLLRMYRWIDNKVGKKQFNNSFYLKRWELWSGKVPFEEVTSTPFSLSNRILKGERPAISDVDSLLGQLLIKCWQLNPEKRPTFAEIAEMMDKVSSPHELFGNQSDIPKDLICPITYVSTAIFTLDQQILFQNISKVPNHRIDLCSGWI